MEGTSSNFGSTQIEDAYHMYVEESDDKSADKQEKLRNKMQKEQKKRERRRLSSVKEKLSKLKEGEQNPYFDSKKKEPYKGKEWLSYFFKNSEKIGDLVVIKFKEFFKSFTQVGMGGKGNSKINVRVLGAQPRNDKLYDADKDKIAQRMYKDPEMAEIFLNCFVNGKSTKSKDVNLAKEYGKIVDRIVQFASTKISYYGNVGNFTTQLMSQGIEKNKICNFIRKLTYEEILKDSEVLKCLKATRKKFNFDEFYEKFNAPLSKEKIEAFFTQEEKKPTNTEPTKPTNEKSELQVSEVTEPFLEEESSDSRRRCCVIC